MESNDLTKASNEEISDFNKILSLAVEKANPSKQQIKALTLDPDRIDKMMVELFQAKAAELFQTETETETVKSTWIKIYKELFNKYDVDFSDIIIPSIYDPAKHFAVIIAEGISMNQTVLAICKRFNICLYIKNLDKYIANDRIADKNYIIIFEKNLSVNESAEKNTKGITLLEALLLSVYYHERTEEYLDVNKIILCSGSRDSSGNNPRISWNSESSGICVHGGGGNLYYRSVVFC